MRYAKGVCWVDDTRIPFVDEDKSKINFDRARVRPNQQEYFGNELGYNYFTNEDNKEYNTQGRFTPNLLVCDDMLNDGVIREGNKPSKRNKNHRYSMDYGLKVYEGMDITGYGDKGSSSRYYDLDKWFDKVIDEIR